MNYKEIVRKLKESGFISDKTEKKLEKTPPNKHGDILWSELNKLLNTYHTDYNQTSFIYNMMGMIVDLEGKKDPYPYFQLSMKQSLLNVKQTGLDVRVKILGRPDCEVSKELETKVFDLDDEIDNPTLPYKGCNHLFKNGTTNTPRCSCEYIWVTEDSDY